MIYNIEYLIDAIVMQAVHDYYNACNEEERNEILKFFRSEWFYFLTNANSELFIAKLKKNGGMQNEYCRKRT